MSKKFFDHIIHGGDYNPDQWIKTPEIWDEEKEITLGKEFTNILNGETVSGKATVSACKYLILK